MVSALPPASHAQPTAARTKPELLAPAGDWECVRAAVANGANAVYFGLPAFNARMRATNFTAEELPLLMDYLHARGVKGYAAFNTLIFTDELEAAAEQLAALARAGVDAAIVQDLGLVSLAREGVPALHLHASTQMTLTSPEGVAVALRAGISRAVLARELSLRELAKFAHEAAGDSAPMPLEVFVHGALCVAYSGQCLTSEALGQRSANRGECAQACRLPYELIVDGLKRELGDKSYLLSPQDLAAVEEIPELLRLGIVSFKVEGRLKTPEYVAAVTQVYRRAIDRAWADHLGDLGSADAGSPASGPDERYRLEMAFSRGLYSGWLHGVNHQELVHARYGKKRGALLGAITGVGRDYLQLTPLLSVRPGDGVVIDRGGDTDREQGGRVYEIQPAEKKEVRLYFEHRRLDFGAIKPGHLLWKTDDPQLNRELRKTWADDVPETKQLVDFAVRGDAGEPLWIEATCGSHTVQLASAMALQPARNRPLTEDSLQEQLGRLGETNFVLGTLTSQLSGPVMLPVSELNRLRREIVGQLQTKLDAVPVKDLPSHEILSPVVVVTRRLDELARKRQAEASSQNQSILTVLCRSLEQIDAALACGITEISTDFEDIRRYHEAVERVRNHASGDAARPQILLATPRIQKAGEQGFFRLIESARPDGVLIRNLGALEFFRGSALRRIGDFSLNVANPFAAELFMAEGLERLTVCYDLHAGQVGDLLRAAPSSWFEITLHQHIPMFHMEHCVFAAFLSSGTDHTNCGRPCDTHRVELRDRVGLLHPLKADVGCRNTLFHAQAQSGAAYFEEFRALRPAAFRVELLLENAEQAAAILRGYQRLLAGELPGSALVNELKLKSQLGVTVGTLRAS